MGEDGTWPHHEQQPSERGPPRDECLAPKYNPRHVTLIGLSCTIHDSSMFGVKLAIDAIVLQQLILPSSSLLLSVCEAFSFDSIFSSHVGRRCHHCCHDKKCVSSSYTRRRQQKMITLANALVPSNDETLSSSSSSSPSGMEGLQERMRRQEQQYEKLFTHRRSQSPQHDEPPETVYLILFHNEQQQQQHVHTIEYPMGSSNVNNYILAFIDEEDCINFATSLQVDNNLNNPPPMVEVTMFEPFAVYCDMNEMRYIIVPSGFGLTPPQMNANESYSDDDYDDDDNDDDDDDDVSNDDDDVNAYAHDLSPWG